MMTGPLGYHVHLCSSTQFVFGDEETVMSQLTKVCKYSKILIKTELFVLQMSTLLLYHTS